MMMKIALTIWGNRVSPVFESAQALMVFRVIDGKAVQKEVFPCDCARLRLVDTLKELGVQVLICGAISSLSASVITSSNITLIPFVTGNVSRLLEIYLSDTPAPPDVFMPGCGRSQRPKILKHAVYTARPAGV